jgi:hypothetical protein
VTGIGFVLGGKLNKKEKLHTRVSLTLTETSLIINHAPLQIPGQEHMKVDQAKMREFALRDLLSARLDPGNE